MEAASLVAACRRKGTAMLDNGSIVQAQTTVTASGQSTWQDTGNGTPSFGENLAILCNAVTGDPQFLFRITTSDDQVSIYPNAYDEQGPVNTVGQRNIHFASFRRYWRLEWEYQEQSGGGSSNSSSLSGQSFNSSSSGGTAANSLSFIAGLTISNTG